MPQKRVYVAADDQLLQMLVGPLRQLGLMTVPFSTSAAVIQAVLADKPDALLLRLNLADGTALSTFRALPENARPPTVVILRPSQAEMREELLASGIADVAVAPLRPGDLAEQLFEVSGGMRRTERRLRVSLTASVRVAGRRLEGTTRDVSSRGLGLSLKETLPLGSPVVVNLAGVNGSIDVCGRVMSNRPDAGRQRIGVRLVGLSAREGAALRELARAQDPRLAREPASPPPAPVVAPEPVNRFRRSEPGVWASGPPPVRPRPSAPPVMAPRAVPEMEPLHALVEPTAVVAPPAAPISFTQLQRVTEVGNELHAPSEEGASLEALATAIPDTGENWNDVLISGLESPAEQPPHHEPVESTEFVMSFAMSDQPDAAAEEVSFDVDLVEEGAPEPVDVLESGESAMASVPNSIEVPAPDLPDTDVEAPAPAEEELIALPPPSAAIGPGVEAAPQIEEPTVAASASGEAPVEEEPIALPPPSAARWPGVDAAPQTEEPTVAASAPGDRASVEEEPISLPPPSAARWPGVEAHVEEQEAEATAAPEAMAEPVPSPAQTAPAEIEATAVIASTSADVAVAEATAVPEAVQASPETTSDIAGAASPNAEVVAAEATAAPESVQPVETAPAEVDAAIVATSPSAEIVAAEATAVPEAVQPAPETPPVVAEADSPTAEIAADPVEPTAEPDVHAEPPVEIAEVKPDDSFTSLVAARALLVEWFPELGPDARREANDLADLLADRQPEVVPGLRYLSRASLLEWDVLTPGAPNFPGWLMQGLEPGLSLRFRGEAEQFRTWAEGFRQEAGVQAGLRGWVRSPEVEAFLDRPLEAT